MLTQQEVAESLYVTRQTISNWNEDIVVLINGLGTGLFLGNSIAVFIAMSYPNFIKIKRKLFRKKKQYSIISV